MDILDFWSLDMTNNKSQKKLRPKQSKIWIKTNNPTKIKIVIAIKVSKMMSKKYSYVVKVRFTQKVLAKCEIDI